MIVSGKIFGEGNYEGLADVNVIEVGTSNRTVTNANGSFSLNVASGSSLIRFTHLNFAQKTVMAKDFQSFENLMPTTPILNPIPVTVINKKTNLAWLWVTIIGVGIIGGYAIYRNSNKPQKVKV